MESLLTIRDLSVDFVTESGTTAAVKRLSLTVNQGEILALVGESGSGKSVTSLSILQLLPTPPARYTSGAILFSQGAQTVDLLQASAANLQAIRGRHISMIFQEPMTSLNPVLTCGRQVAEVLEQHTSLRGKAVRKKVVDWFTRVQLPRPEKMYDTYPHQLSGGQKQRVMIAMAMCCEPDLLICDEPTTALDVTVQKTVLELIRELQRERGMGVLFITHDLGVVSELADRVAILYKGELVEEGTKAAIFSAPQHPYTQALLACRPGLHPKGVRLPVVQDFLAGKPVPQFSSLPVTTTIKDDPLVEVENLVVKYPIRTNLLGRTVQEFIAVDNVSFIIQKGETLGLVGESGCGKTTLGRTVLRLIEPASGAIRYQGTDITHWKGARLKDLRRQVQLVFQDPFSSLNPRLTVGSALAEPLQVNGVLPDKRARQKRVAELLDQVALPATAAQRYPHEFSGGQRQRIVIARALALEPGLLVCDESVSALDVSVQAQVLNLLNDLKRDLNLTLLFISHDLSVVRYMSDRMLVMQAGRIIESGPAEEIYTHPQSDYTRQLLAAIPQVRVPGTGKN